MYITQLRNATQHITFAGTKFLIDPMLAEQGAYPGFAGSARAHLRNPLVALPCGVEQLLDVDAVVLTHTHRDHWDDAAAALIRKDMPLFVQNSRDAAQLREQGFTQLTVMDGTVSFGDITLTRTSGQHGSDEAYADAATAERLGDVCGVVFRHCTEKTLYLLGDTVWTHALAQTLKEVAPLVVVANMGWAHILPYGPIIMGAEDAVRIHRAVPEAHIVATHMGAINHCLLSREDLRRYARDNALAERLSVPNDGDTLTF